MTPDLNRRNFLKTTAGAAGIAGLAGCNTDGGDDDPDGTDTDGSTGTDTSQDPTYSLQTSALEYDLTDLATSEADQHNQAYVQDNYSAQLGVTVLENGEEADLEDLSELHLENQEGETVETTEDGYVPEYAVEDGEELTVRAEVNGEELTGSVRVTKNLPDNFLVDAQMMEGEETVYETPWNTPYQFDSHVTDRQEFLDQRAQKRDEIAEDNVMQQIDQSRIEDNWDQLSSGNHSEEDLKKYMLMNARASVVGLGKTDFEGIGVGPHEVGRQAANEEKILRNFDFLPYEEVFIGGFTNPKEPDVPSAGDGDGVQTSSKVAYVDGDWFHLGGNHPTGAHISDIEEIPMAQEVEGEPSSVLAVSVLGEFEQGMDRIDNARLEYFTNQAVTSPTSVSGELTDQNEAHSSFPSSWSMLEGIRDNSDWRDIMVQGELATDHGIENATDPSELEPGTPPERITALVGDDLSSAHLLALDVPDSFEYTGSHPPRNFPQSGDINDIKEEFLE